MGDSCTWGWGVAQDETYPAVLQTLLDHDTGRGRYQVINAGSPGHTSYQGLTYLRERGLDLHPAIIISGYGFNDPSWIGDLQERLASARRWMPLYTVDDYLLDASTFYRWARWQTHNPGGPGRPPQVPLPDFARNTTEMIDTARQHGARIVLLRFAQSGPLQDMYRDRLAEIATQQGVPMVTYEGPRIDLVHPTAAGYRQLAELLLARLRAEGYVP